MLLVDTTDHDLVISGGVFQTTDVPLEEARQRIIQRLLLVQGEWFLDIKRGLDYKGKIWDKQVPPQVRDAHIQRLILQSAGTGSTILFYEATVDTNTRTLSVSAEIQLSTGETVTVEV